MPYINAPPTDHPSVAEDNHADVTGKALHTRTASSVFGNYPSTLYNQSTAAAPDALDNTPYGTLNDVSMYSFVEIYVTAGEISVQFALDGVTFDQGDHPMVDDGDILKPNVLVSAPGTSRVFKVPIVAKGFRFLNGSAVASSVRYALVGPK